jgi:AraC-like DNA-binding protein
MELSEIRMLTVESLARAFSYSESRFSAKFKEETGYTIQNKIMDEKLNRAFKMLKNAKSKTTVESVASAVGYTDTVYFSRLFLKKHNIYPSDVLKSAKMSFWANQDKN